MMFHLAVLRDVRKTMLKNEGVGAFYKVLSDGLLKQATYTTTRLGTFRILTNKALEANDGKPLPLYQKSLCGLTASAIGACIGSPAELALIHIYNCRGKFYINVLCCCM
ncbi:unnamed protein product [Lactuca virosa]|uniref:Uncharacterized protein n=1 Tax=Lactuca virosa TaxID=75947 RepID=A0AAU9N112_9ASTR|nr:unnamed protein product [Lactuca virosa]